MIKEIYEAKCTGCELCVEICPQDVFRMDEKGEKAIIKYPEDCMSACYECELRCPAEAINVDPFKPSGPVSIEYSEGGQSRV